MIDFISKDRYDFDDLVRLVALLRAPGGCPWDGAQTHLSIRRNFLEEAYEACEGFDLDDPKRMCEELGDVLLQVLFHTDIERAAGRFTLDDVCDGVCKKLVFRHPFLWRSEKLQKKAAKTGFSWESVEESLDKLDEETAELRRAVETGQDAEEELGDVLFAAVSGIVLQVALKKGGEAE